LLLVGINASLQSGSYLLPLMLGELLLVSHSRKKLSG
jgi:hypothetical protein